VYLRRRIPQTRVIDVDSGQHEGCVSNVTVQSFEPALHEPHVVDQVRQRPGLSSPSVDPLDEAADESDAGGPFEVVDRGRIGIGARQWRCLDVKVLAKDVERGGNGKTRPMPGPALAIVAPEEKVAAKAVRPAAPWTN
jgi:hypothetical protein